MLQVDPGCLEALSALADLLATCPDPRFRDGAAALDFARRAENLGNGKSPEVLRSLAAAQAEMGRFPEALAAARAALELARQQQNASLATSLEADIAHFEAGQPRREP